MEGRRSSPTSTRRCAEVAGWITPRLGGVGPDHPRHAAAQTVEAAERRAGHAVSDSDRSEPQAARRIAPCAAHGRRRGRARAARRAGCRTRPGSRARPAAGCGSSRACSRSRGWCSSDRRRRPLSSASLRDRRGSGWASGVPVREDAWHRSTQGRAEELPVLLAELTVRHTRRHMPTRRVALDQRVSPDVGPAHGIALARGGRRDQPAR